MDIDFTKTEETRQIAARIPQSMRIKLQHIAKKEQTNFSGVLRVLLDFAIEEYWKSRDEARKGE